MKNLALSVFGALLLISLHGCGKQEEQAPSAPAAQTETVEAPVVQTAPDTESQPAPQETATPTESVSETEDEPAEETTPSSVQPSLRVGQAPSGPPTSGRFKEGTHYQKIVPVQPTTAPPGNVEVAEVFWYGCAHCFSLDPALESWRAKAPNYVSFVRIPAMWNDTTRMHARLFYTIELLGKLDDLHSPIFREIHVNGNPLNTVEKITAFLKQHGVNAEEFQKSFSSFAVESKLQRADFLNRRYRVQSVPLMLVNGKYSTDLSSSGGEAQLFALLNELSSHEHGG
jgi:protein dithiol oxidoreductase (disulfide-forming)